MGHFWKIAACVAATLATSLAGKPALAAPPNSECLSALMAAFEGPVDASSCPFVRIENERFLGVSSAQGIFFVGLDHDHDVYVRLDVKTKTILIKRSPVLPRTHATDPKRIPLDAKGFYYPFFGVDGAISKKNHPTNIRMICPDWKQLSLTNLQRCQR